MISFSQRVVARPDVLMREIEGESVLLNLATEFYFGLDTVGTRIWAVLTAAESIEAAFASLLDEYEVEPERLRADMTSLIEQLVEYELVDVT